MLELNFCTLFMGAPGFKRLVSVKQIKRSEKRLIVLYYATKCTFLQLIWTGCESSPLSACGNETLKLRFEYCSHASDLMELRTHAGSAMSSGLVAGWKMWNECEQPRAKMATV